VCLSFLPLWVLRCLTSRFVCVISSRRIVDEMLVLSAKQRQDSSGRRLSWHLVSSLQSGATERHAVHGVVWRIHK